MQFDELLQSKALPSYRAEIAAAIAAGHEIDVLYQAVKGIYEGDQWARIPKFLVSIFSETSIDWTLRQIADHRNRRFPPTGFDIRICEGWRFWRSSELEYAEVKSQETSLLCAVPVVQSKTLYSGHVLASVRSLIQFRQSQEDQPSSIIFFAEGISGSKAYFRNSVYEDGVVLQDDNIVLFDKNFSESSFPQLGTKLVRSFGHDVAPSVIEKLMSEGQI